MTSSQKELIKITQLLHLKDLSLIAMDLCFQYRGRLEQAHRVPLSSRRLRQVRRGHVSLRRFRRHPPQPRRENGGCSGSGECRSS